MSRYCLDGAALEQELMKYDIFPELYAGNVLMLMTGIGNTKKHFDRTIAALKDIAARHESDHHLRWTGVSLESSSGFKAPQPGRLHPIPTHKELVPLDEAAGRICASSIIPYPPGIPFVCPGEEITEEMIAYIRTLRDRGEKVIGVTDRSEVIVGA